MHWILKKALNYKIKFNDVHLYCICQRQTQNFFLKEISKKCLDKNRLTIYALLRKFFIVQIEISQ